jgi:nucleoside-diphosphate-sugar epimerase
MKRKVLITGGSGSVGKQMIPFFLGDGYEIVNYDKVLGYAGFYHEEMYTGRIGKP